MGTALATRPNGAGLTAPSDYGYEREQIDLIKQTVAQGATDTELKLFLYTCQTRGLDPLLKQAYFIKRGGKGTIQVGIDGFRMKAAETGEYAGSDDATFTGTSGRPETATVTVYRLVQGHRCPFTATARWDEYVQKYNGQVSGLWASMPHTMLAKCAESLALRKAFPAQLSGLYSPEEMAQSENTRTVDRTTGEVIEHRTQVQRRNSDPSPEAAKHEREDGEKVHPKPIDPATNRPAAPILRNEEEREDASFAPRTSQADVTNALLAKHMKSHKGWMTARKLDPENRALSLWLLNRAAGDGGEEPAWTSRKELGEQDWKDTQKTLAALKPAELTEWVQAFYATLEREEAGATESPFTNDACPLCGAANVQMCECPLDQVIAARTANAEGARLSGTLIDVPATVGATHHGSH